MFKGAIVYKSLGEITKTLNKGTITKKELIPDGLYPVVNSGRDNFGYINKFNNNSDSVVLTSHGANAGYVRYITGKFWAGSLCHPYKSINEKIVKTKYIYYYLKNNEQINMNKLVIEGSIPYINKTNLDKIIIPIPSIDVQNEIVEVLDKFTELTAELEAELEARTKQYSYYEEKLLDLPQHEKVILSEYFEYYRGKRLKKSDRIEGMRPLVTAGYQNEGIAEYISNKVEVFDNALTIDMFGNVFWRPYEFSCDDNVIVLKHKDLNEETAYFYLAAIKRTIDDNEFNYNNQYRLKDLYKHEIDLPLKKEKIIYIGQLLSKFSSLVNDIKEGLPAEIELRRKQYEYYRNKLLTFE